MKRAIWTFCIVLFFIPAHLSLFADDPQPVPTPSATVTFLSPADEDGRIIMDITYANGKVDRIITGIIRKGTSAREKAWALETAIRNQQTQGVIPVSETTDTEGGVKLFSDAEIKGIKISDATQQTINVNPQGLTPAEEPKNASFTFMGLGNCEEGYLALSFDALGLMATLDTYGKTGFQVAQEVADALSGPAAEQGLLIQLVNLGNDSGRLHVLDIPAGQSAFTVDPGGACGISCEISVSTDDDDDLVIPTLSEWGIIFLVMVTMGLGVFRILKI